MQQFIDAFGVDGFPHVNDADGTVWRDYGITYQPSFAFVAADGSIETFGALGEDALRDAIDRIF